MNSYTFNFYSCSRCLACKVTKGSIVKKRKDFLATATGRTHKIKEFITCSSEGVVYVLECPCKLQYL